MFLVDVSTREARASEAQVQQAAFAVFQHCAPASGGIAINIGASLVAILLLSRSMDTDNNIAATD